MTRVPTVKHIAFLAGPVTRQASAAMKASALWLMLSVAGSCAAQCTAPETARAELDAYLAWENGLRSNLKHTVPFSVLEIGRCTFFRANKLPKYFDPALRPAYLFVPGQPVLTPSSPAGDAWVSWAAEFLRDPGNFPLLRSPQCAGEVPKQPCDLTVEVGPWKPSPDGPEKRKVAGEILKELRAYGYTEVKEAYVRDFNLHDPDIWFYIVQPRGETALEGCRFELDRSPHCAWHLFGQSPDDSLKRVIMARPYRLYPPPIGRP